MSIAKRLSAFQFNVKAFLIGFIIGLTYVYYKQPEPIIQVKFPTPYNAGEVVYKDDADTCFEYTFKKVKCPADKTLVRKQPVIAN